MNFKLIICLMLVAIAMGRKGSTPTNCRNSNCKGSVGTVQLESSGTTGRGGSECIKRNGEIRKKCKNRQNKNNSQVSSSLAISPSVISSPVSSSPSVNTESSSGNRDSRLINLGSLFGGNRPTSNFGGNIPTSNFGGNIPTSNFGGNRPTSIFGGGPTTSSIFGGRPTINRPVSSFGSNNHGSGFGNNHNHGNSLGGSLSIGAGPGLSVGFGPGHGSSFGNSFGNGFGSSSSGCRFWCNTPQNQYYCCENPNQAPGGVVGFSKPGQCPPVRPSCPPTRSAFRPPSQCSSDARCPGSEKCCFDTCLQHHTCKPPQGGFFGR